MNKTRLLREIKKMRHLLPRQTIKTLRGQVLSGDLEGANKGLKKSLDKKLTNKEIMINAHRSTRHITRQYKDVKYKDQLAIYLSK